MRVVAFLHILVQNAPVTPSLSFDLGGHAGGGCAPKEIADGAVEVEEHGSCGSQQTQCDCFVVGHALTNDPGPDEFHASVRGARSCVHAFALVAYPVGGFSSSA